MGYKTEISMDDFISVIDDVKTYLQFLQSLGCDGVECLNENVNRVSEWKTGGIIEKDSLKKISDDLTGCMRCGLGALRKNIVFGEGSCTADLMFVGEGPGNEEDKTGQPFVGSSGKLLTKIISAMNFTRESVYICNIVKCRPEHNRNPLPEEMKICMPYLERQIEVIKPKVICTLGAVAGHALLQTTKPISSLRGHFQSYKGIKVMPTFHPAYLLRNQGKKALVWDDMKKIMKYLQK